ncbi:MAG TPA: oligopeptide/dipeptide ABC transporter ATP-binding protein, partial [Acidimicrobiales bacterium]
RMPYTRALLESSPKVANRSHTRLQAIPGRPPNLMKLTAGCAFAPRCAYATERCHRERPELAVTESPGHAYACWNPLPTTRGVS